MYLKYSAGPESICR